MADKYEQAKFEQYSQQMGYGDFEEGDSDDGRTRYRNPNTQARWNFWVASRDALSAPPPAGAQQAVADEREAFLDHWVKDVPEEYRAAARERADKDLLLSLDRGPLRVAADAWQARAALAAPAAAEGAVSAEDQWIEQTRHLNCPVCNGSGHIEDVLPQGDAAQRALLELLLLKDMKDKWEAEELSGFAYKSNDNHRLHNEQRANYLRRKPLAWEAARKAVAATPAPEAAPSAMADCQSCQGTGSGGMGVGCTDCLGTGVDPSRIAAPSAKEGEALLAFAPKLEGVSGPEPTLEHIIRLYYRDRIDGEDDADCYANDYLAKLRKAIKGLTPAGGDR